MIGLATAIPARYEATAIHNILALKFKFGWEHPIEVWEAGEEISPGARQFLQTIPGVEFRNTLAHSDKEPEFWHGFQIKAVALAHSKFRHFIWCDADSALFQNPTKLLQTPEYLLTGSYIFRDLVDWKFHDLVSNSPDNFRNLQRFCARKAFVQSLLGPERPTHFPQEWAYIYESEEPTEPVAEALAETAVFCVDRERHADAVQTFYELNFNWRHNYRFVHGDKELLWLAFLMNKKPFSLHMDYPTWDKSKPLQTFGGEPFYR